MKIRNNKYGIDEKLIKDSFPYAFIVEAPEIIESDDPTDDRIIAMVTDQACRTSLTSVRLGETHNTTHWPGIFGWCNTWEVCTEKCFWIDNNYSPLCMNCKHK